MDTYNFPLGADTKDAPWNKEETPKREFDVFISQTLSKSTTVSTNNYIYNVEKGEDGEVEEDIDTSETNWEMAYTEEHLTLTGLIRECKNFLLKCKQDEHYSKDKATIDKLLRECEGWCSDDLVIMED